MNPPSPPTPNQFDPRKLSPVALLLMAGGVLMLDEGTFGDAMMQRAEMPAWTPMAALPGAERGGADGLYTRVGSVAVIDIWGILAKADKDVVYEGWYGSYRFGTSYDFIRSAVAAAVDDGGVKSILLRINSPGGSAVSVEPAAQSVFEVRPAVAGKDGKAGGKPVVAYADDLCASAAFYLAAQAQLLYGSPGSWIGSIGTIVHTVDRSKMLADFGITVNTIKSVESKDVGSPFRPMSEQDRALLQRDVNEYDRQFVAAVMRGRGVDEAKVRAWAKERGYIGAAAVAAGLADGVRVSVEAVVREMDEKWGSGGAGGTRAGGGRGSVVRAEVGAVEGVVGGAIGGAIGRGQIHAAEPQKRSDEMDARDTKDGADANASAKQDTTAKPETPAKPDAAAILAADTTRRQEIRKRAFAFSGNAEVEKLRIQAEDNHWAPEKFSDEAVKLMAAKNPPTGHVASAGQDITVGDSGRAKMSQALALSLIDRVNPEVGMAISNGGAKANRVAAAIGFDSPELAAKAMRAARGEGLYGMGVREIAVRCAATVLGGYEQAMRAMHGGDGGIRFMAALSHSSSDFPNLMSNVANKSLQASFEAREVIWRAIARKGVSNDYKERTIIATSMISRPQLLPEGQTAKLVSFGERKEAIAVDAYASKFGFSYQTLRNDDLGAFTMKLNSLSESFVELPDDLLLALLALNSGLGPAMSDGSTLFHANHNNITTGAALAYAALQLDFIAFEKQKDFNPEESAANRRFITVRPQTLLVPTDLKFVAEDLAMQPNVPAAAATPSAATQRNVLAGRFTPLSTPKLTGTRRYLFGPPGVHAALEVAFLDGNESAQVVELPMTNPMEMQWQATLPGIGVSAVNYETAITNAGQ